MNGICTLDLRRGRGVPLGELADLAETYLRGRVRKGDIGYLTARNQRAVLSSLATTYGDRPVQNFRRLHVENWLETRGHLKASTRRSQHSMVRSFTQWLLEHGHLRRDPMAGIKAPRQPRTVPRAMPAGDIGKLLRTCPDARARAVVALGVGCGLRCIEIAGLCVEDWDRSIGLIRVTGKSGHQRELPVPYMVQRHLTAYMTEFPATVGPLIRSYRIGWEPLRPQTISKMVGVWMSGAGVKVHRFDGISAHALRHTCASDVLDECGDLRVVMEMLGHANLSTTSIYLRRANIPKMRNAMEGRAYKENP